MVGVEVLSEFEGGFQSTVQGAPVAVTFGEEDAVVALNGRATVGVSDLLTDNGVVHGVDAVLTLPMTDYTAELNSESEVVPPDAGYDEVESGATGSLTASLDLGTETPVLSVTGDFSGLTSPLFAVGDGDDATAGHLHGPATQSENAGVLFPLNISGDGGETPATLSAELELTPETFGYLVNGLTYLNIHTETYPACEIRGQIISEPEVLPEPTGRR